MRKYLILIFLVFFAINAFAQFTNPTGASNNIAIQGGVGLGSVIAVVTSWSRNESILWAILHGILGWIYVIYFGVTRQEN